MARSGKLNSVVVGVALVLGSACTPSSPLVRRSPTPIPAGRSEGQRATLTSEASPFPISILGTATPDSPAGFAGLVTTRLPAAELTLTPPSSAALSLRAASADMVPVDAIQPSQLLFVTTRDGTLEIYRMQANGSDQVRLTHNSQNNFLPTWSPDGTEFVFLSQPGTNADKYASSHIHRMTWDGKGEVDLTPSFDMAVYSLNWSPDGTRLAVVASAPDGEAVKNVYILSRDGSELYPLTSMSSGSIGCMSPVWSPDSSQLALYCRGSNNVDTEIMGADGSDPWYIGIGQVDRLFWLPSGKYIASHGSWTCDLAVLDAQVMLARGNLESQQVLCLDPDVQALNPNSGYPLELIWSPMVDTQFMVRTASEIQIFDLAAYSLSVVEGLNLYLSDVLGPPSAHSIGSPSSWSVDGRFIAFTEVTAQGREIYRLALDSLEIEVLTSNLVDDFMPAWRP